MAEEQKDIIEKLLKEKGITKRELAKKLGIKENGINRTLKNPKISISKLGIIATVLEVDIKDLLPKKDVIQDLPGEFQQLNPLDTMNQLTFNILSEALNRSTKTIDNLVRIIADHFPDKKNSDENIPVK